MKHPHARYLQALLLERLNLVAIKANLLNLGLKFPPNADFAQIEAGILSAADPILQTYLKTPTAKLTKDKVTAVGLLMKKLRVTPFFDKTYQLEKLIDILRSPAIRDAIEGMLLTTMAHEEIVASVNRQWNRSLSKEDLGYYRDLFWDTDGMDMEDWFWYRQSFTHSGANIRFTALSNREDHETIRYLAGVPSGEEIISVMNKHFRNTNHKLDLVYASSTFDVAKAKTLIGMLCQIADRVKKYGGDQTKDLQKAARLLLDENKARAVGPAHIHTHALPEIPKTIPTGAYKPVGEK